LASCFGFGAFETTLAAIHAMNRVVFNLWLRNILAETVSDTQDKLEVKLWLDVGAEICV
jgi:hypothetical protein